MLARAKVHWVIFLPGVASLITAGLLLGLEKLGSFALLIQCVAVTFCCYIYVLGVSIDDFNRTGCNIKENISENWPVEG